MRRHNPERGPVGLPLLFGREKEGLGIDRIGNIDQPVYFFLDLIESRLVLKVEAPFGMANRDVGRRKGRKVFVIEGVFTGVIPDRLEGNAELLLLEPWREPAAE